jgi:hypothetical protein
MLHPEIINFLALCKHDPLLYVMGAFPWESDLSIQKVPLPAKYKSRFPNCNWGPDEWQCDFLTQLGEDIKTNNFNGRDPVEPIRMTVVSGRGVGKSTMSAWLVKYILDTRPYSVGTVTANTASQLRTKTWAEVGKWHNISATKDMFKYTLSSNEMSLVHVDPVLKNRWKCFAQTCESGNSEAFRGQHSDSTSFYIFDEASKIDDALFTVRDGSLTRGEPMSFDFGNGTRNTGRFKENCVGKYRHRYRVWSVDSREAYTSNKSLIEQDIKDFGEDSDYIRVEYRGLFPRQASLQLIANDKVEEAQKRLVPAPTLATPLYIGVDVALQGSDSTVIYPRLGSDARSYPPRQFRGLDPEQIAEEVKQYYKELRQVGFTAAGIFIDGGGGYGSGVFTHLRQMGIHATLVYPGRSALKSKDYGNRVTEMWAEMAKAIGTDLCLPDSTNRIGKELAEELTEREAGQTLSGQLRLVSKTQLDKSPDIADALALTFARETLQGAGQGVATVVPFYQDED